MYNKTIKEVQEIFDVDISVGLSNEEVIERQKKYGKNEIIEGKKKSVFNMIWDQLNDPMIFILAVAAIISGITTEISDAIVIFIVVFINALIGVIQEIKAEKSMDTLKKLSSPRAYVRRDGNIIEVDSKDVVVGDVVILDAGRYVPCDIRLTHSSSLMIEESSLTGESVPVIKSVDIIEEDNIVIGDKKNLAFASTLVTSGRGEGVAIEIGMNTEIGKIASMLYVKEEKTPLQQKLGEIGKLLGVIALSICGFLFIVGILEDRSIFEMLLLAISLAVAAVPEGMPAIVSIVLAMGVRRMVKQNAIIRKLPAVETLGSVSVICSDKTGTLTQNKMTVTSYFVNNDFKKADNLDITNYSEELMLLGMLLCCDATEDTGDPTEIALVNIAKKYNLNKKDYDEKYKRINELPFDSDRKMMTTIHEFENGSISFTKGAIDNILKKCNEILIDGKVKELSIEDKSKLLGASNDMSKDALRVLALAYKKENENHENEMIFVGMLGMIDPPRLEVKDAVQTCRESGITTVMITGDHKVTAFAIAKELGIAEEESQCMSGNEIELLSDDELSEKVKCIKVFARVSPEHKVRLVKAFKSNGNIVSMTGDGVNDAPSLKTADIGVAMGITGTDVAKNAADMTLMDDNFTTIVKAVEEGRHIYTNIRKAIFYLLSCNIGEIFCILIAVVFGMPTPLQSIHLLWVNLVTDTTPALSLGVDPKTKDIMKDKPRDPKANFFKGKIKFLFFNGLLIGSITLIAFISGIYIYTKDIIHSNNIIELIKGVISGAYVEHNNMIEDALVHAQTMSFMVLSISQLFHSFNLRSEKESIFKVGVFKNKYLLLSFILGIFLQCVIIYTPLASLFHVHSIGIFDWFIIIGLSILPLVFYELYKLFNVLRARH